MNSYPSESFIESLNLKFCGMNNGKLSSILRPKVVQRCENICWNDSVLLSVGYGLNREGEDRIMQAPSSSSG